MLEGLKVIEFATYIAAPSAGGIMCDWGAEVIKVEPLNGDPIRNFFGTIGVESEGNPVFDLDNRGKKSIALDTSTALGRRTLMSLIESADVFLTNVRPGGLERAGLDWSKMKEVNPALIYASVSGYGLEGAERDRPGFDMAAFWSRAGVGRLTTPKNEEPMPIRTAMGDHITGMATVSGILAALYEREKTGKGKLVETSLLRTGIYSLGSDFAIQARFGRVASTRTRHTVNQPLNNFFRTSDDEWICILPRQSESDWHAMARALGREDLVADERFSSARSRKENASALVDELDIAFANRPLKEWESILDQEDLVWAPFQTPAAVIEDEQAHAAGAFVKVPGTAGKEHLSPASPVRFHGSEDGPKGPAPTIGQHTREILEHHGYSASQIEDLAKSQVIPANEN